MMSSSPVQPQHEVLFHNGKDNSSRNEHKTHYKCSQQEMKGKSPGALVDGGANGGFSGDDVLDTLEHDIPDRGAMERT
jgi:hypothetical protein